MPYLGGVGAYRQSCDEVAAPELRRLPAGRAEPMTTSETHVRDNRSDDRHCRTAPRCTSASSAAGEPLVLVCGTSQPQQLWAPLLPALSARYRVVTYDHRGIGNSTRGDGEISMASLADDLAALLGELGLDRAHVLGWSLGSTVAQELALRHPQRVAGLVLVATWGRTDVFQASVFAGLGHPWRTGHRDVALAALGIAFSPQLLDSPQFPAMMEQLGPLFPSTPVQMATGGRAVGRRPGP